MCISNEMVYTGGEDATKSANTIQEAFKLCRGYV